MADGLPSVEVELEVPFHDVDAMQVVWHGRYAKYFEIARCHLLDEIKYNYPEMNASGFAWPIIDMRIRYAKPARFQQKLRIRATIAELDPRLLIRFLITDVKTGERLTRGYTAQVAVDLKTEEMLMASPPVLFEKIKEWKKCSQKN